MLLGLFSLKLPKTSSMVLSRLFPSLLAKPHVPWRSKVQLESHLILTLGRVIASFSGTDSLIRFPNSLPSLFVPFVLVA